jgi:hypothetical protein
MGNHPDLILLAVGISIILKIQNLKSKLQNRMPNRSSAIIGEMLEVAFYRPCFSALADPFASAPLKSKQLSPALPESKEDFYLPNNVLNFLDRYFNQEK